MRPATTLIAYLTAATCFALHSSAAAEPLKLLSLAGEWNFRLDPKDEGLSGKWFLEQMPEKIALPGSTDQAGFGAKPDKATTEWLNRVVEYVGPAWYERDISFSNDWALKRIVLHLERCHWETRVWVDGRPVGMRDSLSTPHEYDLTQPLKPRRYNHRLTIRVDNRYKVNVGGGAHSMSDHTQTNWNGIAGRIELRGTDPVWIEDVQVYPNVAAKTARLSVTVHNANDFSVEGRLEVNAKVVPPLKVDREGIADKTPSPPPVAISIAANKSGSFDIELPLGDAMRLWDEFSPNLYQADVSLTAGEGTYPYRDEKTVRFGMREFAAKGTQFALNGRPTFLRGTLECCVFPLTGYPPTDADSWWWIIRKAKSHGLNHFRFHSWCPPEAAFEAADREGFILQVEGPFWTYLGEYPELDAFIRAECDRILRTYGNHPSFCMFCVGNEPFGDKQTDFLAKIVEHWKRTDPRRLYTGASGWPNIPENQYQSLGARIQSAEAGLTSRFNGQPLSTDNDYRDIVAKHKVPAVSHEMGQWCSYPNLDEIGKYTGVVRARNFEIFRQSLADHHMLDRARDFLAASGKLQFLLYKEEIEAGLRTPGFGGFQLLGLTDFPGQGLAPVGVLDPFWRSKGYATPAEFRQFCCETVPLLRMKKFTYTDDETLRATAEVAHYGPAMIAGARPRWTIADSAGRRLASGNLPERDIPTGGPAGLGEIKLPLADMPKPAKLTLTLSLDGTPYANHWDFWVYPAKLDLTPPDGVLVATSVSPEVESALGAGKKVLLLVPPDAVRGELVPAFSTIFWNTACFPKQQLRTLGILCDSKHPALARFPTEFHADWQWWDLVHKSRAMVLDDFPADFRPIVQVIDDWYTNRKLGLLFEARVGEGKLLMCSIDPRSNLAERPVARQFLRSLFEYMKTESFGPRENVEISSLQKLLQE